MDDQWWCQIDIRGKFEILSSKILIPHFETRKFKFHHSVFHHFPFSSFNLTDWIIIS